VQVIITAPVMSLEDLAKYGDLPASVFNRWIGLAGVSSVQPFLFFLIIPVLAAYPFGDSFFQDKETGYIKNLLMRTNNKDYCIAKFFAVFLSGGIVVVAPLILNLLVTMLFYPSLLPDPVTGMFALWDDTLWCLIFLHHPYLYVTIYMGLNFIFGGLFATICLPFSYLLGNRYIVLLVPFIISLVLLVIPSGIAIAPYEFLYPDCSKPSSPWVLVLAGLLFLLPTGLFWYKGAKEDVF